MVTKTGSINKYCNLTGGGGTSASQLTKKLSDVSIGRSMKGCKRKALPTIVIKYEIYLSIPPRDLS